MAERIIIVDDKQSLIEILETALGQEGYETTSRITGAEAAEAIASEEYDLLLCDVRLPDHDGMELLRLSRQRRPDSAVIMITAYGSIENAIECMKLGADDYVTKPFNLDEIRAVVAKSLEKVKLRRENSALRKEIENKYEYSNIIGGSKPMLTIFEKIRRVSPTDVSVLITGETGTGKELVSKAIHYNSPRAKGPFVALNCAAIPEQLIESELYGHVRGAFTGAFANKRGLFEEACGGTLLLDEIAELQQSLQAKLLRTLDDGKIRRVGDTKHIPVDIRLICSTNRNLEQEVKAGRFRLDLYHRIRIVEINIPPLRERREDIPRIARRYMQTLSAQHNLPQLAIEPGAMRLLMSHQWVGNIRELINIIEQSIILSEGDSITEQQIAQLLAPGGPAAAAASYDETLPLKQIVAKYEADVIKRAIQRNSGSRKETASQLGISERTLYYKMEEYKLT